MRKFLALFLASCLAFSPLAFSASDGTYFDTDTKLMLHMDGSDTSTTFTDSSSGGKSVTATGDAQIDTAQSKFGGASGLFDGTDTLTVPNSADFDLGSGDWTIDWWGYYTNTAAVHTILTATNVADYIFLTFPGAGGYTTIYNDAQTGYSFYFSFSYSAWHHIAFVAASGKLYVFLDGVLQNSGGTSYTGTFNTAGAGIIIGGGYGGQTSGNIDEFRMVKGTAVWTSDFTPPSAAYTAPSTTAIKTFNGLAYASTKTVNGLAKASVKTWNGLA